MQSHDLAMKLCGNDPSERLKRNLFARISDLFYETGKTTRAIAAHFRFAAVAVVVAHPEIGAVGRGFDQQNPIRPYPAMTIANSRDLLRAQMHFASTIVDHDKVVPRTVHLGESQHMILDFTPPRAWDKERRSPDRRFLSRRFGNRRSLIAR